MADEITLEGKEYISSKRAAQLSGYAQDYIGQLARGGSIAAQRVGGLWYVSMESLEAYKNTAEAYKPELPTRADLSEADALITFDGKDYVSASRAAEITGYHQDYVGQLSRSGAIAARQVGSRWYVDREALLVHKNEKDSLLAAVQAQSVGIPARTVLPTQSPKENDLDVMHYRTEEADLLPKSSLRQEYTVPTAVMEQEEDVEPTPVPIRIKKDNSDDRVTGRGLGKSRVPTLIQYIAVAASVLVIVLGGLAATKYVNGKTQLAGAAIAITDKPGAVLEHLGGFLEHLVVTEMVYRRTNDFGGGNQ